MIFGREPATISGAIAAMLALLLSWDETSSWLDLSNERVGLIMAAVNALLAVVVALYTRDVQLSLVLGVVNAVLALAIGYGLDLSVDQTSAIVAAVTVAFSLINRAQNSPAATPSLRSETVLAA